MTTQLWLETVICGAIDLQTDGDIKAFVMMYACFPDLFCGRLNITIHFIFRTTTHTGSRAMTTRGVPICLLETRGAFLCDKGINYFNSLSQFSNYSPNEDISIFALLLFFVCFCFCDWFKRARVTYLTNKIFKKLNVTLNREVACYFPGKICK